MLNQSISLKQQVSLKLELNQIIRMSELFSMTNEQLFEHLKEFEGTGQDIPGFSIADTMGVKRQIDIQVKSFFIVESSSNYIKYDDFDRSRDHGRRKEQSGSRKLSTIMWILKTRENMLKAVTSFILRHHHDFFWRHGPIRVIHPISQDQVIALMNKDIERYNLDAPINATLFSRLLKNKTLDIEDTEYPMHFFFCRAKSHPHSTFFWINKIMSEKTKVTDRDMMDLFYQESGIMIGVRRTMNKLRKDIQAANTWLYQKAQQKPFIPDEQLIRQFCDKFKVILTPEDIRPYRGDNLNAGV